MNFQYQGVKDEVEVNKREKSFLFVVFLNKGKKNIFLVIFAEKCTEINKKKKNVKST